MKMKYDESFPERAGECAAKGLNNIQIAREMGIAEDTFYVYLKQFPAFAEAVELGRRAVRDKVDGGMMDLAMGNCFVQTVKCSDNGHETKTIRQRAPDLNAIIRWLERNKHCADDGWEDDVVQNADPVVLNIPANFKYDESFPEDAEFRAAAGETDLQIAGRLGICQASFYNYKKQFPAFAAALERGRRECHIRLRRQLLALALGNCTVTANTYRDGDFRKSTERQLPPNLKAIKYWLAEAAAEKSEFRNQKSEWEPGTRKTETRIIQFKRSLFPRSRRAAARPVMLAAWAKQPLLKETLIPRSGAGREKAMGVVRIMGRKLMKPTIRLFKWSLLARSAGRAGKVESEKSGKLEQMKTTLFKGSLFPRSAGRARKVESKKSKKSGMLEQMKTTLLKGSLFPRSRAAAQLASRQCGIPLPGGSPKCRERSVSGC